MLADGQTTDSVNRFSLLSPLVFTDLRPWPGYEAADAMPTNATSATKVRAAIISTVNELRICSTKNNYTQYTKKNEVFAEDRGIEIGPA